MSKNTKNQDFDIDSYLKTESSAHAQQKEIERILELEDISRNPLEILELDPELWTNPPRNKDDIAEWISSRIVKLQFRKKSLIVHPDKCSLPKAPEAFQLLKKAESQVFFLLLTNPSSPIQLY